MADPVPAPAYTPSMEYQLKKYLLLLATLVATVTYVAGLNLPGGSWLVDNASAGEVAGDSILRQTNYRRYILFYYFNAISFAASLLLGLLVLLLKKEETKNKAYLLLMWTVMLVDGLGLMVAYAAGISHDRFTTVCAATLVSGVSLYGTIAFIAKHVKINVTSTRRKLEKKHEILLVLAIFGATSAYLAGMNPPGGFWRSTEEGHHAAGDPVLQRLHPHRYKAFFFCNTTAFVTSVLAIAIVMDHEKLGTTSSATSARRWATLYGFIIVAIFGLGGSYAAGSCRDGTHTAIVVALGIPVVLFMYLQHALHGRMQKLVQDYSSKLNDQNYSSKLKDFIRCIVSRIVAKSEDLTQTREYIQLLATLAATVAYTAGLDPPGGVWAASGEGHNVGDPILLATHPGRYKVFFYFNSAAFVASLVIIVMLQNAELVRGHALEVALILDFFGLIGAYATGSSRDTSTCIYTLAIAGGVLIYVVIHIAFCTLESSSNSSDEANLERKREVLLLLAILAATLAYQAGLTPPGGLWEEDDHRRGHRAGFPVLQDTYPKRYKAFFYCNAASFMASVALIVLLLNKNLYKPGIQCYALYVCMVAGMFALLGAYAAGSSLHLKTSIVFLAFVAAGIVIVICVAVSRYIQHRQQKQQEQRQQESSHDEENKTEADEEGRQKQQEQRQPESSHNEESKTEADEGDMAYYLMLVGILAASVTYLTGLKPPGGMWRDDGHGHSAGNPVLYDTDKRRYNVFFYSNSTSFMASIIVIALLLSRMMSPKLSKIKLGPVHVAIVMDVLALLVAYAAGTSRESRRSWKVIMLFPIEVFVVFLFYFSMKGKSP